MLIDTHCHVHELDYPLDREDVIARARYLGVEKMICVGTSEKSSTDAVAFVSGREGLFASVGVHPHEAKDGWKEVGRLLDADPARNDKIVAVGEIGLDYFYTHSPRDIQIAALEAQIDLALKHNLPIIFHVREAFSDFWPIFDNFQGIRGELHSFTDTAAHLEEGLKRGLYIGVNGISTFTKDEAQKAVFQSVPLSRVLLETDAPFLTPAPFRGKVNEPAFVKNVAEHQALIRGLSFDEIAETTTANATALFAL
ncbi:MAG TPA: TatD family hydrolase [Candidatus Saccharimonadales bacterium]|nr:TatD family hydrolase [Candidatus Saccharimonadales bacterium]